MGVHVGTIGAIGGTGTHTVSGLPFEPVAVMFWNVVGELTPIGIMFGAATSSSDQWVMWGGVDDETIGYTRKYNEGRTDCCIINKAAPFTTVAYQAAFTAFTSDGFTFNVTTFNQVGQDMYYTAIGGQNVSAAHAGTFSAGASTGSEVVTGVGFKPIALVVGHQMSTFDSGSNLADFKWGVGVGTATDQYASFGAAEPASTHSQMHRTDEIACGIDASGTFRMDLTSMDSDGFTMNVTDASTGDHTMAYLAIDAAAATVGNGVIPDSPGDQTLTTPAFEPEGVFFTWNGANTPSTTGVRVNSTQVRVGVGAGTLAAARGAGTILRDSFPFGVYQVDGYEELAAPVLRGDGTGIGANDNDILAEATLTATAMGSATLTWTTAASGADRAYGWLALPGDVQFPWAPGIYRRIIEFARASLPIPGQLLLEEGAGGRLEREEGDGFIQL